MARTVPFYQAYDHLDEFMKKKVEENEVESGFSGNDEHKSPIITPQPKGPVAKLRRFGSSMVADILFSKTNEQPKRAQKRRVKRSQSVIISGSDQKKLKRRTKNLNSIKSIKNRKNAKRPIVKLENTKSGVKIAANAPKKENQKPKDGVVKKSKKKKPKKADNSQKGSTWFSFNNGK